MTSDPSWIRAGVERQRSHFRYDSVAEPHAAGTRTYDALVDLQLAEINIATLVAPLDDPQIDDFRNAVDEVNAIAEAAPGFVWRLQTDEGNATAIQAFPNPLTIVNLSVWESPDAPELRVRRTAPRLPPPPA